MAKVEIYHIQSLKPQETKEFTIQELAEEYLIQQGYSYDGINWKSSEESKLNNYAVIT